MKNTLRIFCLAFLASGCALMAGDLTLWYQQPAAPGMNEGLPVGNGTFGGLILGGVDREVVQFNDISLWTGTEISTDDYAQMGAYQKFGNLVIEFSHPAGGGGKPATTICASEHKAFTPDEEVAAATDGNAKTKWCVEHHGQPVVWEIQLPEPRALNQYAFTAANDVPARDPSTWDFLGSNDGKAWTTLDQHKNEPPFAKRGETKNYSCANSTAFKFYRLVFQPNAGVPHFQIAEIAVPGVTPLTGNATDAARFTDYRRALDLATATHTVSYKIGDVTYTRETFASHPAGVMAMRLSADKPGACSGVIELNGAHHETTAADKNALVFSGALNNGMKYEAKLLAQNDGGSVGATDGRLAFTNCNSVVLLLAGATDYVMDYAKHFRDGDPHATVEKRIADAGGKTFAALKAEHVADFQSLFNRVALDLGTTPAARLALPTDQRKVVYSANGGDPGIEEIMFQYGRYLLISCSRPGGLPANLQGLWNDSNKPPWHSDYHANINIQMNYWPAEPANLGECHTTLFDLIVSQLPAWRKFTAAEKRFQTADGTAHGWAVRTSHGIHGDEGWQWDLSANAWYCQHFWMHYEFGRDKAWLKTVAYPVMKETCEFWEPRLKALPDGRLVVPNGWSPEHGPHEDGVSYNQEIVRDLFDNFVQAADALGADKNYRDKIAALRDRLATPGIGSWGQLMEWLHEQHNPKFPELDTPNDHHRHTSHLFAVYPGTQISASRTPELAKAAKVTLDARGTATDSDVREWSFAWRTALYARLCDAGNAHTMLQMLLADRNTCKNLFGLHPPMQMDGNFGITAGICEMLVQSEAGEIDLLPALPAAWPAGSVTGLRARGGYEVSETWQNGKLVSATVKNVTGDGHCQIRYAGKTTELDLQKNATKNLNGELQ
jgi:alpha-L-fucosidase 2